MKPFLIPSTLPHRFDPAGSVVRYAVSDQMNRGLRYSPKWFLPLRPFQHFGDIGLQLLGVIGLDIDLAFLWPDLGIERNYGTLLGPDGRVLTALAGGIINGLHHAPVIASSDPVHLPPILDLHRVMLIQVGGVIKNLFRHPLPLVILAAGPIGSQFQKIITLSSEDLRVGLDVIDDGFGHRRVIGISFFGALNDRKAAGIFLDLTGLRIAR